VGGFAQSFIPLYKAHPLVGRLALCDVNAERLDEAARKYDVQETYPSLDAACDSDLDALVLITQNWLHGPQALQALRAGKHVYSAVPTGITVDEVAALVRAVEQTGLIYMLGETSYYYPSAIYCRQRHAAGDFGHVVYAEAEYLHDWDHGLYPIAQRRGGEQWLRWAGKPPLLYPTHSCGFVVSVTGARMTHVSAHGFVDHKTQEDGIYVAEANDYGNVFSNETALFTMSDGSACRINEFRRIGHPGTVRMSLFGTEGSFEHHVAGTSWLTKDRKATERLDELLAPTGVTTAHGDYAGLSRVHDAARLPKEFAGMPSGHAGSHQFLVEDFVRACETRQQPPIHVWQAARYCVPGLVAHESAKQGGQLLEIPDFGDRSR
jgi:predicted dehydrogenase